MERGEVVNVGDTGCCNATAVRVVEDDAVDEVVGVERGICTRDSRYGMMKSECDLSEESRNCSMQRPISFNVIVGMKKGCGVWEVVERKAVISSR